MAAVPGQRGPAGPGTSRRDGRPPKPGPNYVWNGSRWVKKQPPKTPPKGGPKTPPTRTPPRTVGKPPRQTAQQWADKQAQRIVDEQIKAIREQQTNYNQTLLEQAQRQSQAAEKFAQMVQGLGIDRRIQSIYGDAGRDISGMAGGFAGDIRSTAMADAAQQTNMLSGTGPEGAVRNEGTDMGDVVYGVGGYIPGKSLGEQGAAFASDAAMQPGFMLQQRINDAQKAYQEGLTGSNQTFLDSILQAKTGKRDISSDLYDKRVSQNMAERKMRLDQYNEDRNYWLKMQAYYMSIGKMKLAQQAEKRAQQAEQRYRYETMGRDADGNVAPKYVQLPNGTIVPRSTVSGGKGKKGLTPNAKAEVLQSVLGKEDDILKALPDLAKTAGYDDLLRRMGPPTMKQRKELASVRAKIIKELWQRYAPLAITPQAKQALRKMLNRILQGYKPGGSGSLTEGLGL